MTIQSGRSLAFRKLTHDLVFFPIKSTRGAGESKRLCHEREALCSSNSCRFLPAALCSSQ
jgi:hypothetical protein